MHWFDLFIPTRMDNEHKHAELFKYIAAELAAIGDEVDIQLNAKYGRGRQNEAPSETTFNGESNEGRIQSVSD
ncbi:unnamed protein product [Calicophoron daubneyi]|uniref:Uncharacterized protein n=1 Tax=Calicophoron daubneyi TaxID=300641 RepID=A0AAV2TXI8_CALDB